MRTKRSWSIAFLLGAAATLAAGCAADANEREGATAHASEALRRPPVDGGSLSLTIDRYEALTPNDAVEGRPVYAWFTLTNHTPEWRSGYVVGQVFPKGEAPHADEAGQWAVTDLAPGQSVQGVVQVTLPRAAQGVSIDVYYYEDYEILGEFSTHEGPPLVESDPVSFDVAARYSVSIDDVYIWQTRSKNKDTDYLGLAIVANGATVFDNTQSPMPLGDLPDGDYPINLPAGATSTFDIVPNPAAPEQQADLDVRLGIENLGATVEKNTKTVLDGVSSIVAGVLSIAYPGTAQTWGRVDDFTRYLNSLQFAGCDGPVAIDHLTSSSAALDYLTYDATRGYHDLKMTRTFDWDGKDRAYTSQDGCGESPRYKVDFTFHRHAVPEELLSIWPPNARVRPGGTVQLSANGATDVHWHVDGDAATNGYIDETTGLYHAPARLGSAPVRIRAESGDRSKSGSAFVGIDTSATPGSVGVAWSTGNIGQGPGAIAYLAADVNGDHKTDVLQPWANGDRLGLISYLSNGTGLDVAWGTGDVGTTSDALAILPGDVDGDGSTDLIAARSIGGRLTIDSVRSNKGVFSTTASTATGQGAGALAWLAGDVDGDGKTDLIQPWYSGGRVGMIVYRSTGAGFSYLWGTGDAGQGASAIAWKTGDVNGDGMTDVIQLFDDGGALGVIVYESTGASLVSTFGRSFSNVSSSGANVLTGDPNGDGRTDLVVVSGAQVATIVGEGTGMRLASKTASAAYAASPSFLLGDVNGDRQDDLIELSASAGQRLVASIVASQGSWFGPAWSPQPDMGQGAGALAWLGGDVDGDGKADVIQPFANAGRLGFLVYRGQP